MKSRRNIPYSEGKKDIKIFYVGVAKVNSREFHIESWCRRGVAEKLNESRYMKQSQRKVANF